MNIPAPLFSVHRGACHVWPPTMSGDKHYWGVTKSAVTLSLGTPNIKTWPKCQLWMTCRFDVSNSLNPGAEDKKLKCPFLNVHEDLHHSSCIERVTSLLCVLLYIFQLKWPTYAMFQSPGISPIISWASYQIRNIVICACTGNAGNGTDEVLNPCKHGHLTRYVKLRVVHALGMPGTFSATKFKGNDKLAILACITALSSRTYRNTCRDP